MPELQWDELDFMECLEVEPQIEEYEISYFYEVRRDDLILYPTVRPCESVIDISLYQSASETPLLDCALFVFGKVRHINDKRGEYLEFTDCIIAPRRFAYLETQTLRDAATPRWSVKLSIKPRIQIRYLD